ECDQEKWAIPKTHLPGIGHPIRDRPRSRWYPDRPCRPAQRLRQV
ncbi:MAG: hypothetical protein, partial [Olavius algarvensis Gamma 1 endosymbiont]